MEFDRDDSLRAPARLPLLRRLRGHHQQSQPSLAAERCYATEIDITCAFQVQNVTKEAPKYSPILTDTAAESCTVL